MRRPTDAAPTSWQVADPLPAGEVQATLDINTGGDQMSVRPVEFGLELSVRERATDWRWRLASCRDLGSADVVASTDARGPAYDCDGVLWELRVLPDRVEVTRNGKVFGAVPLQEAQVGGASVRPP